MKRASRVEAELDSINMASVLMLLSRGASGNDGPQNSSRVFECKTCNRKFPSFQALGGHRASHKKPRAIGGSGDHHSPRQHQAQASKPRVHECSICGLEFSVGQALGGHMRRHRAANEGFTLSLLEKKPSAVAKEKESGGAAVPNCLDLDLNKLPSESDVDFRSLSFGLGLPMVDCFL
ncbi:C2H2-type zinc finger family protein [Wolffia australiana]